MQIYENGYHPKTKSTSQVYTAAFQTSVLRAICMKRIKNVINKVQSQLKLWKIVNGFSTDKLLHEQFS